MFDPNPDPLSDPELAEIVTRKLLQGADHPWELEQPPTFDPLEAVERFMKLGREVNGIVNAECEMELWPSIKSATFHGEIVLPPTALIESAGATIRASNFANLITILNDEQGVQADVLIALRRRFERNGYRFIPASALMKTYGGHHRGTKQFPKWVDRLFGYL